MKQLVITTIAAYLNGTRVAAVNAPAEEPNLLTARREND